MPRLSTLRHLAGSILIGLLAVSAPGAEEPPGLAVLPFWIPTDEDFAVTVADRFAMAFMHRSQGEDAKRRFTLLENDPIPDELRRRVSCAPESLSTEDLAGLRTASQADFVFGACEIPLARPNPAIKRLRFRLLDVRTGEVAWSGMGKDDVRFLWLAKDWEGGGDLVDDVMKKLDLKKKKNQDVRVAAEAVPKRVAILPPSNLRNPQLVEAFSRSLQRHLIRDKTFVVVSGTGRSAERVGATHRDSLVRRKADAVLTGSLMSIGVNNTVEDNLTLSLRLVDLSDGRHLWSETYSTRRLWWKEDPETMVERAATHLSSSLAGAMENGHHAANGTH